MIKFGMVYSTINPSGGKTRDVLVLSDTTGSINPSMPDVKVAPISYQIDMATNADILIDNYIIRFSGMQNILVKQLNVHLRDISKIEFSNLKHAWKYAVGILDHPANNCGTGSNLDFLLKEEKITSYMMGPIMDLIHPR